MNRIESGSLRRRPKKLFMSITLKLIPQEKIKLMKATINSMYQGNLKSWNKMRRASLINTSINLKRPAIINL